MTANSENSSSTDRLDPISDELADDRAARVPEPDHLPPVEPPSAGFIMQLFVVPAVIVMLIVLVWLGFGKLAGDDQNWQSQVAELKSSNSHRRDRAALTLAQMLSAAHARKDAPTDGSPRLTENPQLARELAAIYRKQLEEKPNTDAEYQEQMYLARALGMLDVPEALPPLQEATRPDHDPQVRRHALVEIAVIANRAAENDPQRLARLTENESLEQDLISASTADEPTVRHVAAYALGLYPTPASRARLEVLLSNGDAPTRANAAIGLARQGSTAGFEVFEEILQRADDAPRTEPVKQEEIAQAFESFVTIGATLEAVTNLADDFDETQRARLIESIRPIAAEHRIAQVRLDAEKALHALNRKSAGPN